MRKCYHKKCDNYTEHKINWNFYGQVVQSLIGRCQSAISIKQGKIKDTNINSQRIIFEEFCKKGGYFAFNSSSNQMISKNNFSPPPKHKLLFESESQV